MKFKFRFTLLSLLAASTLLGCGKDADKDKIIPDPDPGPATPYELSTAFGQMKVPDSNPTTVQGVELGRMLFYEKKLSGDNTISCGSCHQQQFAFTDGLALSPGVNGALGTRNTMSLANSGWYASYMWDGATTTLEQQAHMPIVNHLEMNTNMVDVVKKLQATDIYPKKFRAAFGSSTIRPDMVFMALSQFQRTLVSDNSKFDRSRKHLEQLSPLEQQGFALFRTHPVSTIFPPEIGGNCGDCHGMSGIFALDMFKNNGLDANPVDRGRGAITGNPLDDFKFKVPTLRNIALTAPYMHDGRFKTLEEVLDNYSDHVNMNSPNISPDMTATNHPQGPGYGHQLSLTAAQKTAIIAFLHTLTDNDFVTNPAFSDPFEGQ